MHQIISSSWTTVENTAKPFTQAELGAPCCQQVLLRWRGHQVKPNRVFTSVTGFCWLCSSYLRTLPTCSTGCQQFCFATQAHIHSSCKLVQPAAEIPAPAVKAGVHCRKTNQGLLVILEHLRTCKTVLLFRTELSSLTLVLPCQHLHRHEQWLHVGLCGEIAASPW